MSALVHRLVAREAAAILRGLPELAGAQVVAQDAQALASLLAEEQGQADGLVVVVSVDEVRKLHARPAKYAVSFAVNATELVPVNRERPGFATALDAAAAGGEALDGRIGYLVKITHTTPGDGILVAVAAMEGEFVLESSAEKGEGTWRH